MKLNAYVSGVQSDLSHLASNAAVDVDAIRARLRAMSDAELIAYGKEMRMLFCRAGTRVSPSAFRACFVELD